MTERLSSNEEPLRTEIIEKYNDGYEHGMRRAAEVADTLMGEYIDDRERPKASAAREIKQAILAEANNQQGEGE